MPCWMAFLRFWFDFGRPRNLQKSIKIRYENAFRNNIENRGSKIDFWGFFIIFGAYGGDGEEGKEDMDFGIFGYLNGSINDATVPTDAP